MRFNGVISTEVRDRSAEHEVRGTRCWRSAEIVSEGWFVVEHCLPSDGKSIVRQWVAPTFRECQRILRVEGAHWTRVMAYLRVPLSVVSGYIFAEVEEVHEVVATGSLVLRFMDGMTVMTSPPDSGIDPFGHRIEDMRLLFRKGTDWARY